MGSWGGLSPFPAKSAPVDWIGHSDTPITFLAEVSRATGWHGGKRPMSERGVLVVSLPHEH